MTNVRCFVVYAAVALLSVALPQTSALGSDFQEMLYPLRFESQGATTPEDAAISHIRACILQSPRLFTQNLLLGVCDGSVGTINAYSECLHVTTFDNGKDAFTVYDLPFRLLQEETVRAVDAQSFDTEDEDVAALLMFAGVSSYYGEVFMYVDVAADDPYGEEYRNRVVVARVKDRWYAMPRGGSSAEFYEIADAMPLTVALTSAAPAPGPEPIVLTPETMADHEICIEVRSWETSERDRELRSAAELGVRVRFDPEEGPIIREFLTDWSGDGTLVVRKDDDVLMTAPVDIMPWLGNDGGLAFEFTIQRDLLDGFGLVLHKESGDYFTIDIDSFLE